MKKVKVKGRKVLAVEVVDNEEAVNELGIHMPRTGIKDTMSVRVIEVGSECWKITTTGDVYVLPKYGNDAYTINGESHYLINEDDLNIQIC